jgi:hypothetical protein
MFFFTRVNNIKHRLYIILHWVFTADYWHIAPIIEEKIKHKILISQEKGHTSFVLYFINDFYSFCNICILRQCIVEHKQILRDFRFFEYSNKCFKKKKLFEPTTFVAHLFLWWICLNFRLYPDCQRHHFQVVLEFFFAEMFFNSFISMWYRYVTL